MAAENNKGPEENSRISVWDSLPLYVWKWLPSVDLRYSYF